MKEQQLLTQLGDNFYSYSYLKRPNGSIFQYIAYGQNYGNSRREGRGETRKEALLDLIDNL